ncbi:hypothetical protein ACFYNO_08725 [Kitasatospora sp. NPDC006697]|uniref:hypothetical protein n=1 Tax=Kitasatospora sp. NPDC006697 TaxID=3364020 RepID=UPI0036753600
MSSRESDNAHPSSRRGSGAPDAYPSGTPPYGIPGLGNGFDPFAHPGGPAEPEPEAPKTTETTLTTRISINIPGSRPIPPVVVRSAVKPEEAEPAEPAAPAPGPRHRSAPATPVLGVMDASGRTSTPPDLPPQWRTPAPPQQAEDPESTGEWFRPRQRNRPDTVGAPAAQAPQGAAPGFSAQPAQAQAVPQGAPGLPGAADPFATDGPGSTPPQGVPAFPGATPPHGAPGFHQSTPPQGMPGFPGAADPFAGEPAGPGSTPPNGVPAFPGSTPSQGVPGFPGAADPFGTADPFSTEGPGSTPPQGVPGFAGPTPPLGQAAPFGGEPAGPAGPGAPGMPGTDPFGTGPAVQAAGAPAAPGAPAAQRPTGNPGAPGRFARPQQPLTPFPGTPAEPEDTQINGFEPIPAAGEAIPGLPVTGIYGAPAPQAAERGPGAPGAPAPQAAAPAPAPAPAPAKKAAPAAKPKGRSKAQKLLVTGVGGVAFLGAAAYGTGLMLNQADVPRGTTVLGTAIGGDSRDQAVHQLDSTVGKIGQQPVPLKLGDQAVSLDPATAGLSFDTTATVDGLTHHSYNPSDVLQSLTGGSKAVAPVVRIDRAKLKAALDTLVANSQHGFKEGYVQFDDSGNPVVVPGQPGQAVDDSAAVDQVAQSYQDRAAGRTDAAVALAVTAAQPKVATQALQQAADGLGKQIAGGPVTIQAGTKKLVLTPPKFGKALLLVPDASGNIGPQWNLDALGALVGNTFDKVKYKKADGSTAPITTQDVADAITQVYDKGSAADRTFRFRM